MSRHNTIRINYGALPKKPGIPKLLRFCAEELGLKRGDLIRVQNSYTLNVAFVEFADLALANKVCEEHGKKHEMTGGDKKKYPVIITMEDGTVLVRLFDLSPAVSNIAIAQFLEQFGDVHDVYEEKNADDQDFAGIFTGVRAAKMVVKKNIPSWVTVNGEQTHCSYFGQRQTCRHCHDFLHIGVGCVQNKKLFVQKTYADAAKQPAKPQQPKTKPKTTPTPPPPPPPPAAAAAAAATVAAPKKDGKKQTPVLPTRPVLIPDENMDTSNDEFSQDLMPPPAGRLPSGSGLLVKHQNQQFHAGSGAAGKPTSGKSDGNETDSSTSSRRSLRNKYKKPKIFDDEQDEVEEDL